MTDLGPVIITAREVYDAVIRVSAQVADLSGQIQQVRESQQASDEVRKDHEARIRALEKNRWPLPALGILISMAAIAVAILKGGF